MALMRPNILPKHDADGNRGLAEPRPRGYDMGRPPWLWPVGPGFAKTLTYQDGSRGSSEGMKLLSL
jgi:hypothetical protein